METVLNLLEDKGHNVFTINPNASVLEATQQMNEHAVGSLVVVKAGKVIGIFTERDVLRRIVAEQRDPADTKVADVMTEDVITAQPDTPLHVVRSTMFMRHIRHIPVVNDRDKLLGMVSIGDLNAWSIDKKQAELEYMENYINGRG